MRGAALGLVAISFLLAAPSLSAAEVRLHLGRGTNLVAFPLLDVSVRPTFTASDVARLCGSPLLARSDVLESGRSRLYAYRALPGDFNFSIRPGNAVAIVSSSERTLVLTIPEPAGSGLISTVVGNGQPGFSGDGGPATACQLRTPADVVFDSGGNMFIADAGNKVVRRVDARTKNISTVAGVPRTPSLSAHAEAGDGGPAEQATFLGPIGLQFDARENLYLVDGDHYRRIDRETGRIDSVAPRLPLTLNLVVTPDGTLYHSQEEPPFDGKRAIADRLNRQKRGGLLPTSSHGYTVSTTAPGIFRQRPGQPPELVLSWFGAQLVTGDERHLIFNTFASDTLLELDLATKKLRHLVGTGEQVISSDGLHARDTSLFMPRHAIQDSEGNLYVSEEESNRIRRLDRRTREVTTFAGDGYIDWLGQFRGEVVIPGRFPGRYRGDGGPALEASLNWPSGLRFGPDGALYVADTLNHAIRRISMIPATSTVNRKRLLRLGRGFNFFSLPPSGARTSPVTAAELSRLTGSRLVAKTEVIEGVARWKVYLSDLAPTDFPVQPMEGCLVVSPAARTIDFEHGTEPGPGRITSVAGNGAMGFSGDGGPPHLASFSLPFGLAIDSRGRLIVADTTNHRIRRVDLDGGTVVTIAGDGKSDGQHCTGFWGWEGPCGSRSPDGLPGTLSSLNFPTELAVDTRDNIYFSDSTNRRIARLDGQSSRLTTITTQPMSVTSIVSSPDGSMYFSDPEKGLFRITDGKISAVFSTGKFDSYPEADLVSFDRGIAGSIRAIQVINSEELFLMDGRPLKADLKARTLQRPSYALGSTALGYMNDTVLGLAPNKTLFFLDIEGSRLIHQQPDSSFETVAGDSYTWPPLAHFIRGRLSGDGGPAKDASFNRPFGMAVDAAGNVFIADTYNHVIRKIQAPFP